MIYRHVDILRSDGYQSFALHLNPGARFSWFENNTPIIYLSQLEWKPADILVLPEICAIDLISSFPVPRKVIFNQNSYLTFNAYRDLETNRLYRPYQCGNVIATLCVSDDNFEYLQYAFPSQRFFRIPYSINNQIFYPNFKKHKQIAYMPRKHSDEANQVLSILKHRGVLEGYKINSIGSHSEVEVAETLRASNIFLSFGYPEGLPLPPLEAMSCGAIVIGYHGRGGREYFDREFSYPIEILDIISFARTTEQVIRLWDDNQDQLIAQARRAAHSIAERYSENRERCQILKTWGEICGCSL